MIVGIDLGTTNSLIGRCTENGIELAPNRLGAFLTPSVVGIDEDNVIMVGETAREYGLTHPARVAQAFKRSMGTGQKYTLGDREFVAEELSAYVLKSLKEDAESFWGEPVTEAVISVPAYFDEKRKKATKHAGELAGLKVERIISEPTAAAIAYGLYEKSRNTRFLVFDLGGGTFDVSILELFENILEVRAVAGDNYLGGEDFTEILVKEFLRRNDIDRMKLSEVMQSRLYAAAEKAKRALEQTDCIDIQFDIDGRECRLVLSDTEYEELCEELLDKIRKPVQRSLSDAQLKLSDIDEVVLVGGCTKLKVVRKFVAKLFKKFPQLSVNPDEAVAIGAAIQAAMKERNAAVKEVILTDVCSFTLGTEVSVDRGNGFYESGHYFPIIERNTVIPVSHTERLYTLHDDQENIRVRVLQGESRFAANNLLLGELNIKVPKNKAGEEAVDVTYTYDINSLLEVEIKVVSTGEKVKQIIKGRDNEMTLEEMEERMKELSYLKVSPRDQEENRLLIIRGERMYEESQGDIRILIDRYLDEFEQALKSSDRAKLNEARRILSERLDEIENNSLE
ncbi:MAG: Hsp70 family protein [Lachnospiraceae bacterium]